MFVNYYYFSIILFIFPFSKNIMGMRLHEKKLHHAPRIYSNNDIVSIASMYNDTYFNEALKHIMIPRVVGTRNHEIVKQYLVDELEKLGYEVEEDRFLAEAPRFGELEFTNVVGRLNPNARRYLALACHYDSKYLPPKFVGATDSAVPCAMLLQVAHSLRHHLDKNNTDLSLKLIFFDGEEAFVEWTDTDSLYGARNLASKWAKQPFPVSSDTTNTLHSIDVLVLLDLLGAKNPKFYSFFRETQRWHSLLASAEKKLKAMGQIPANLPLHFLEKSTYASIQDDHLPFLERDVSILHVIPVPFPKVWHTQADDYSVLDFPTITTLNKIIQVFVLSYINGNQLPSVSQL